MDMEIRARTQAVERETLSPRAALSEHSRGRLRPEVECPVRTVYQRDPGQNHHSTAFRRLEAQNAVFLALEGDHYRTRLTRTLEVAQIARTIARGLQLNEDLTEAAALGHDLGHTPFGHAGERALKRRTVFPRRLPSSGNQSPPRGGQAGKKNGRGLNIREEVRDGIRCLRREAGTLESRLSRLADRIAYINHDISDAMRGSVLQQEDLPDSATLYWVMPSQRIAYAGDLSPILAMKKPIRSALRPEIKSRLTGCSFMFGRYTNPAAKGKKEEAIDILKHMYEAFRHPS